MGTSVRRTHRSRWIASEGMRITGRSTLTTACRAAPPFSRTSTRPATPRSRSNHVYHSPPP
eukprot:30830-Pelagococcus_subviridis.AAC.10